MTGVYEEIQQGLQSKNETEFTIANSKGDLNPEFHVIKKVFEKNPFNKNKNHN